MLDYVKKKSGLAEDEARWFFQQLVIGLDYCHQMVLNYCTLHNAPNFVVCYLVQLDIPS